MQERKFMGQMMTGSCPICGGVVAAMWLEFLSEREKQETVGDWFLRGLKIETLERYDDDPAPSWCGNHCERYQTAALTA